MVNMVMRTTAARLKRLWAGRVLERLLLTGEKDARTIGGMGDDRTPGFGPLAGDTYICPKGHKPIVSVVAIRCPKCGAEMKK